MRRRSVEANPDGTVLGAVRCVAGGNDESLVLRSSADGRWWIQVSRVSGEDVLLCEGSSNEYMARYRELTPRAVAQLQALGWHETSDASFTCWADVKTPRKQAELASLLFATLVDAYDHDP